MTKSEFDKKFKIAISKVSEENLNSIFQKQRDLFKEDTLSEEDIYALCVTSSMAINQMLLKLVLEEILELDD